jgi:hypothetical protein
MSDKIFSIRLPEAEYQALKKMAEKEVRTANSWLRSRIVQEARNLHLLDQEQAKGNRNDLPREDISWEHYTPPTEAELAVVCQEE